MTGLVADFGGTNIRIGLVQPGADAPQALTRHGWDAASDPGALLHGYLDACGVAALSGVAISVAGPVGQGLGRLTNQNCVLDAAALSARLGAPVRLMNDMTALGLSLGRLGPEGSTSVYQPAPDAVGDPIANGQMLVVNAGTGFNICPVAPAEGGGLTTMESESGHAALPATVAAALAELIPQAGQFVTMEDLFAGPGLARFHELRSGEPAATFAADARAGRAGAMVTLDLAARLFGMSCADLAVRHWAGAGLWLAGSAALAMGRRTTAFSAGFGEAGPMSARIVGIAVRAITDDHAPLLGCMARLGAA